MRFDPDAYWIANGPFLAKPNHESPMQRDVLRILKRIIRGLMPVKDVIDIGCGQGRLAHLVPRAAYTGLDIGPAQIGSTRAIRPDGHFLLGRVQDWQPKRTWELVMASEVLLHIPPDEIAQTCDVLKRATGKWLLTVDWTEPINGEISRVNWLHDYRSLIGEPLIAEKSGLQTVFLWSADRLHSPARS